MTESHEFCRVVKVGWLSERLATALRLRFRTSKMARLQLAACDPPGAEQFCLTIGLPDRNSPPHFNSTFRLSSVL